MCYIANRLGVWYLKFEVCLDSGMFEMGYDENVNADDSDLASDYAFVGLSEG